LGFQEITLKLPTDYTEEELRHIIRNRLHIRNFSFTIGSKSLDARKKSDIHWLVKLGVTSAELYGEESVPQPVLEIPRIPKPSTALVVGSGPAGIFSALVLQKAGFHTTLIERGQRVDRRVESIRRFEAGGTFDPAGNYAFGEGGAGTFSDGKLTARTKRITLEKNFIIEHYVRAGAPAEIAYLAHPHLGTDNLRHMAVKLRHEFESLGGILHFETTLTDLHVRNGTVLAAGTSSGDIEADTVLMAHGHSAHETYRMLMLRGVRFRTKNFAIGSRIEHPQELINTAQWGRPALPGVKAAEYRLTASGKDVLPVFTFCMCPGGTVVPATPYSDTNIVNGMSRYSRNGRFANAACVAGINLAELLGREVGPQEALDWLGQLEQDFYRFSGGYQAPFTTISGFINRKQPGDVVATSYPLGLQPAPLWEMLPSAVSRSLVNGLKQFSRKLKGFENGIILGLESKTSSPLQALREDNRKCQGFSNLYLAGEGSGWSGGIISSGVDGIRTAMAAVQDAIA